MRDLGNMIAKNSRSLTTHKSITRIAIEKSTKLWIAPLAVIGASALVLDAIATWRSSMRG